MKIILRTLDDEVLLSNYNSYLELDKTLSSFSSKKDFLDKLGIEEELGEIVVLDNNGKEIDYNPELLRTTLSFYKKGKGYEFARWIYQGSSEKEQAPQNEDKLALYFLDRLNDFKKDVPEDEFDINNISNKEGQRLYTLIKNIKDNLLVFIGDPRMLSMFEYEILPGIDSYIKKGQDYDYAYMRKFVSALDSKYGYKLAEPKIEVEEINKGIQDNIVNDFKTKIHNHFYPKKQVNFDDIIPSEETKVTSLYDENGIKYDEKEFLEEFNKKKLSL